MTLIAIEKLTDKLFGMKWKHFHEDTFSDQSLRWPGVYLLAYSRDTLQGKSIKEKDILYVGMSNAQGGVRTRLMQFRNGVEKYGIHSGAKRFYREYGRNQPFSKLKNRKVFFYAAFSVACLSEKAKLQPADLRALGHVACLEYYAIARIRQKTGHMPPLNKFGKRPVATD